MDNMDWSEELRTPGVKRLSVGMKRLMLAVGLAVAALTVVLLLHFCGSREDVPAQTTEPMAADQWSKWVEQLPEEVDPEQYLIQEQALYSIRNLETTSSVTDTKLSGWTFVETVDERGEFLDWSEWSQEQPAEDPDREIESEVRYRSQNRETSTSDSSTKNGWTYEKTTEERTDFGSWGSWTTEKVSSSPTVDADSKKQYRYRDREYTTSESSSLSGWTLYDTQTAWSDWSGWSAWSDDPIEETETRDVTTQTVEIPGKKTYTYGAYFSNNSSVNSDTPGFCAICAADRNGGTWHYKTWSQDKPARSSTVNFGCQHGVSVSKRYSASNGKLYYFETVTQEPSTYKTQYAYRTRTKTTVYCYYREGGWSEWSDSKPASADGRQIENRTVYRSRSCVTNYTYHFYRWGDWSEWSAQPIEANKNRNVESDTFYRHRDREIIPTHYFKRWTDWSIYTTVPALPSETRQVDSYLQLRYRLRSGAGEEALPAAVLSDVSEHDPNREAVEWVMERGILKGVSGTEFAPNSGFTRRQMAIAFWRAMGYPEPQNLNVSLLDVTGADPYRKAVLWMLEAGLTGLETADSFGVDSPCTRGQFITALYRAAGSPETKLAQEPFEDVDQDMISYNAVLWAYENNIAGGLSTTEFGVDVPCTRMQMAVMLWRTFHEA